MITTGRMERKKKRKKESRGFERMFEMWEKKRKPEERNGRK